MEALFAGPGEIRTLCRAIDWSATPLGPAAGWPPSLRAAVRVCLDAGIPLAVWAGPDLTLVYNEGYVPVLGPIKHPWALGRPGREVWPEFWDRLGPELRRVMENGETVHHEAASFMLRRGPELEEAFFTYAFTPIREEDGEIVGALNVFRESTERVRLNLQREQSLAWLAALQEQNPGLALRAARGGRILYMNPSARAAFAGEIGGNSEAPEQLLALADQAFVSGGVQQAELERGGRWFWLTARATGDEVNIHGWDVTERRLAEEQLRESEERYRKLVDMFPDAVFVHHDGRVVFANPAALRLFGASTPEALLGMAIAELAQPEERAIASERIQHAQAGRRTPWREMRMRRLDGQELICEISGVGIDHRHGSAVQVVMRDISARKQAEQALLEAKARLEEADRNKTQFLAMLSHELRNPLAPIRNCLYVLDRAAPGGEQARRARDVISRQVAYMIRLIDDLLDVTRIERGKIQLRREHLDLNELAQATVEDNRSLFIQRGIQLDLRPAPGIVWVHADRTRLAQVIGNLLWNAAKFTPRGGSASVWIRTEEEYAVLSVTDTGKGIEPEILPRLFEPFVQADTTIDRGQGGLGLGLALVKGLVEEHGGSVTARSAGLGRGAEFSIRVPLCPTVATAVTPRHSRPEKPRWRVLIIEDSVDAAESLREFLALEGHEVAVASDGPDGIVRAREFHPDFVFCDIGLPGMDGYAVARALRAEDALKNVRLVALTGYALPEDLERAAAAGFDRHLAKPPSLETLEAVLGAASVS